LGAYFYLGEIPFTQIVAAPQHYLSTRLILNVTFVVLLVVLSGSIYKYFELSGGGKNIALSLGGRLLSRNSASLNEKILLNVVDEISIASGMPTPSIYILEDEGINAFAAGVNLDDTVIGVTRGCVEKLTREELQGVIAHEFSHIFNSDMKLNLNLVVILHGILLIGIIGKVIFDSVGNSSRYSSRSSKKSDSTFYLLAVGSGLMAIGYGGTLLGNLIKASVSRNREYLADATAVQYTRYPEGIAGALKKIGYYSSGIRSSVADTYSHFYFALGVDSFFDTHPPLTKRIQKIDRFFNGDYSSVILKTPSSNESDIVNEVSKKEKQKTLFEEVAIATVVASVATVNEKEVQDVHNEIQSLPDEVLRLIDEPLGVQALLLSMMYDESYKVEVYTYLHKVDPYLLHEFNVVVKKLYKNLKPHTTLITSLALNTLKLLSLEQYQTFKESAKYFIAIDGVVTIYEWSLFYNITRPLEINLGILKTPKSIHYHIGSVKSELEVIYSLLAQKQYVNDEEAQNVFDSAMKEMGTTALKYRVSTSLDYGSFLDAVNAIETLKPPLQKKVFEGLLHIVQSDGKISIDEYLLVSALSKMMQIPLPKRFT